MIRLDEAIARLKAAGTAGWVCDAWIWEAVTGRPATIEDTPAYTSSMDAALTLVDGRAWWEIGKTCAENSPMRAFGPGKVYRAAVANDWGGAPFAGYSDVAPVALCIAALTALFHASGIVTEGGDAPAAPGAERLEPARTPNTSGGGSNDRG